MEGDKHSRSAMASLLNNNSSSSTIRFLGLLKQPDSDSRPFELDESDVIWSSDLSDSASHDSVRSNSQDLFTVSISPTVHRHTFLPDNFGLSAALSDERRPLVQRKPALKPSLSAASASQTIPLVPVPVPRTGLNSEKFPGPPSAKYHQSAPMNVPVWPKANGVLGSAKLRSFLEDDEETEEEMLPPHEIVARSHMTTFSVFQGVGRTLKGRDLRRVRNAVWQKTGFLD